MTKTIQSQMETSGLWVSDILHKLLTYSFFKFRKQVNMFDVFNCILLLVSTLGGNKKYKNKVCTKIHDLCRKNNIHNRQVIFKVLRQTPLTKMYIGYTYEYTLVLFKWKFFVFLIWKGLCQTKNSSN